MRVYHVHMDSIVIIGYRGVGKSTIGKALASRLALPFVDSDEAILQFAGKPSVQSIWDEGGEDAWRGLEEEVVLKLLQDGGVIALGGGAPMVPVIHKALEAHGCVVFLSAPLNILMDRLAVSNERPALSGDDQRMLQKRMPIYSECATVEIDASDTFEQTVSAVVRAIKSKH